MPPFHSRSTGANRIAFTISGGDSDVTSSARPSAARACGRKASPALVSRTDRLVRSNSRAFSSAKMGVVFTVQSRG